MFAITLSEPFFPVTLIPSDHPDAGAGSDTAVGTAVTYCTVTVSTGLRMPYDTFHDAVTLVADPLIEALAPVNVGTAGLPYA
jgi:hypothetical protein